MIPDTTSDSDNEDTRKYGVTFYRFIIALIYIVNCNVNMLAWGIFIPLQSNLQSMYDESLTFVNFTTVITGYITCFCATPFVNYYIDRYGLRIGFLTGILLTVIGLWIRCLAQHHFIWLFLGQCLIGISLPYFYVTPQKFSNVWFAPNERQYSTGFMTVSQNTGTIVGPLLAQAFMNLNADSTTKLDQLHSMFFFNALLGSVCFIITAFIMKERPDIAPSKAAIAVKYDALTSFKKLVKNYNAMVMIVSTALVNAVIWSYIGIFQQLIQPFGFNGDEAGNIMSISVAISLSGLLLGAWITQRFKKYNLVINGSTLIAWLALIASFFAVEQGSFAGFCITFALCQWAYAPAFPIALEYGVELAFPVEESMIGGFWYVLNQGGGVSGNFLGDVLLGNNPTKESARLTFAVFLGLYLIFMIPNFFVKQNLKRDAYETNTQLIGEEDDLKSSWKETRIEEDVL